MDRNELFNKRYFRNDYHKLWVNIFFTSAYLEAEFQKRLEEFNLTHQQYRILKFLKMEYPEPLSMSEIKDMFIDRNSDFTRLADRLAEKGFIEREADPANRRRIMLSLTGDGLKLITAAEARFNDFEELVSHLSSQEVDIMNNLLTKIRENIPSK
jgi:DNA-binding MarR family transcriptional regulator